MTKYLLFHSFNNSKDIKYDPYYNLSLKSYKNLIFKLSKKVNPHKYTISFDDGYESVKPAILYASNLGFQTIIYIITNKINKRGFLSKNDILDLYNKGTKIGSHSHTHCDLTKLDSLKLKNELKKSKYILCKILNQSITEISLPYGEYNKKVINYSLKYYNKIAISRPLFFKNEALIGRLSIHQSNYKDINFIVSKLQNKINLRYILKLLITSLLKKIMPSTIYRKIKSILMSSSTINYL